MQQKRFLLNRKTGVKFPYHPLLVEKHGGMVECDENGHQIIGTSQPIAPYYLNPITKDIVPYTEEMANKLGWIPVQSSEHADQVMAELGGDPVVVVPEGQPEGAGLSAPETTGGENVTNLESTVVTDNKETIQALSVLDITKANTKTLAKLALEQFDEQIDDSGNTDIAVLREQVQVMINNKLAELQEAS